MQDTADMELLREYVQRNSEAAFAALVTRHVNLVYSAAMRKTGNLHAAEEITQAVFIILAKKARRLNPRSVLSGWLYQTARLVAASFLRAEIRRARREQEAYMRSLSNESEAKIWPEIEPLLEDAMGRLGEKDRNAIVLRFFEGKSFHEIGAAVGASENAAKKRVGHALEKLRKFFAARGAVSTTAIIAGAISAGSVQAAPAALTKSVTALASAKGSAVGGSTLTLIKGALKLMAWSKIKTTSVVAIAILLAGTAVVAVRETQTHRTYSWQREPFDFKQVDLQPPQVRILPSHAKSDNWDRQSPPGKMSGLGMSIGQIVLRAYGARPVRTIRTYDEPPETYDFIANLPTGNPEALQQELKRTLGIVAHRAMIETNVLVLSIRSSRAPSLRPAADPNAAPSFARSPGQMSIRNGDLLRLLAMMEGQFQQPIVDHTGLSNHLDMDFKWNDADATFHDPAVLASVRQALENQLGLDLTPGNEPVEMLVVEKTR